ncbi:MAG: D-alanyl-D-alanine carboxypeptidase [Deltaproteobacteria bacterium]|nr:D-alanyl-D-alanine carboxypeptidase [Deltaproteobacteria bacterium]
MFYKKTLFFIYLLTSTFFYCKISEAAWQQQISSLVQNGAVLAVDQNGNVLYSLNAQKPYVPASTLKVATSLAALQTLGKDFRFKTEFFLDSQNNLYVKGYGDPFLISEELLLIAQRLQQKGIKAIHNIFLDTSYFDPNVEISGLAGSLNPYDAYNGALLANFNTINIIKNGNGSISSAEPQTPITEITQKLATRAPYGKSRINVAVHRKEAPLYVGYLLKEFLQQVAVPVRGQVVEAPLSPQAKLLYTHYSTKNLSDVLKPALKYSQNLINNQIFLTMGAVKYGAPATVAKGKKVFTDFLRNQAKLVQFNVEEGSGISRKNYLTALEMDKILVQFFPYYSLLPEKNDMWVKTGTLSGVACLVGYFKSPTRGWVRFVIFLNQGANHRDSIAKILKTNL